MDGNKIEQLTISALTTRAPPISLGQPIHSDILIEITRFAWWMGNWTPLGSDLISRTIQWQFGPQRGPLALLFPLATCVPSDRHTERDRYTLLFFIFFTTTLPTHPSSMLGGINESRKRTVSNFHNPWNINAYSDNVLWERAFVVFLSVVCGSKLNSPLIVESRIGNGREDDGWEGEGCFSGYKLKWKRELMCYFW